MVKPVSKAALCRRIKELEREIADIHAFHIRPVIRVTHFQALNIMRKQAGFIPVHGYTQRYCLHDGEIGQSKGTRYCVRR